MILIIGISLLSACVVHTLPISEYKVDEKVSVNASASRKTDLQQLLNLRQVIDDNTQEHNLREKASMNFIELLQTTLSTYNLSDRELSDLKLNVFICDKQKSIESDTTIRLIVFMGYPEIFGTLERIWTFAEIYQKDKKYIQTIYEKSSETPTNCKMIEEDGKDYILLYGGTTVYTPAPLFISFWELSELKLLPGKVLNCIDNEKEGNMRSDGNKLIFESTEEQGHFDGTMNEARDSSLLLIWMGTKTEIYIFFENGMLIGRESDS